MADFEIALANTLRWEDSTLAGTITYDAGGTTRFGVSQRSHPEVFPEIIEASVERALEIAGEVKRYYWRFDHVDSQEVANKIFDMAVNMGLPQAVRFVQRCAYVELPQVDGIWGPKTQAAVNAWDPDDLLACLRMRSTRHYESLAKADPAKHGPNLRGWLVRAKA